MTASVYTVVVAQLYASAIPMRACVALPKLSVSALLIEYICSPLTKSAPAPFVAPFDHLSSRLNHCAVSRFTRLVTVSTQFAPFLVSIHQYIAVSFCQSPAAATIVEPALSSMSFILSPLCTMPHCATLKLPFT